MPLVLVCEDCCVEPDEKFDEDKDEDYWQCPVCKRIFRYIWFDYWEDE